MRWMLLVCLLSLPAHAHDAQHANMAGEWIGRLGLKDPVTRFSCCGNLDCQPLPDGSTEDRVNGVRVIPTGEFIPQNRVIRMATPDGGWWRCHFTATQHYGEHRFERGTTRCLIGPGHGS
jgi:hypothetical protein